MTKPLPQQIKEELYLITCSLGFLSSYAQEEEKSRDHQIYHLIKNLKNIVKLYKTRYHAIINDSFRIFDEIVGDEELVIDTVCFSHSLLLFHGTIKKHFHPNQKAVADFWLEYKRTNKQDVENFKNSRYLAKEFYGRLR